MAKTYLSTVKYEAVVQFEITGVVDRHDIIGAVFGQSEGLLGETLDLRELQKNGKIGRIEIDSIAQGGKTKGKLILPSSLDMVETSVLAAAIETVDKVGPCDSKFTTVAISDTRSVKRNQVIVRAKQLLSRLMTEQIPESSEITRKVREGARIAEVREISIDKIASGPEVNSSKEIIIVEGRADVLNLLKHGIKNAVGMAGSNIPQAVIELCKNKTATVFLDGDRGGSLILRKLQDLADVDFAARAPAGKEVEELTGKEILQALKRKIPLKKDFKPFVKTEKIEDHAKIEEILKSADIVDIIKTTSIEKPAISASTAIKPIIAKIPLKKPDAEKPVKDDTETTKLKEMLKGISGSMKAILLDDKQKEIKTVEIRSLMKELEKEKGIHAIVFDGIITKRLIETAEDKKIKVIAGIKEGKFVKPKSVKLVVM